MCVSVHGSGGSDREGNEPRTFIKNNAFQHDDVHPPQTITDKSDIPGDPTLSVTFQFYLCLDTIGGKDATNILLGRILKKTCNFQNKTTEGESDMISTVGELFLLVFN
jgi:hypothetical protein